jgi:hypothetical protein
MTTPLFAGLGLGVLVAAQVGPVWLLATRSVILGRLVSGIMIGLGTASWFTVLSTAMALVRRLAGRRVLQAVNVFCGLGLVEFGLVLAWQTAATSSP